VQARAIGCKGGMARERQAWLLDPLHWAAGRDWR
jgi:hypothetical protein